VFACHEVGGRRLASPNSLLVLRSIRAEVGATMGVEAVQVVNLACGKEDRIAVHWLQSTAPEILKVKIGEFSVTSFTSITGLLERAA
jgi:hypothetical protein